MKVLGKFVWFPRVLTKFLLTGSSTETVAFQVYEILKIDHEFLQFFWLWSKIEVSETPFQYVAQFIAPTGGSGAIQIFSIHDYGSTSFVVVSTTMDFPSSSLNGNRFAFAMVSIWLPLSSYWHPIPKRNSSSLHKNDWRSSFGKHQVLLSLPKINFLYDSNNRYKSKLKLGSDK